MNHKELEKKALELYPVFMRQQYDSVIMDTIDVDLNLDNRLAYIKGYSDGFTADRWVSVGERMPEEDTVVIAFNGNPYHHHQTPPRKNIFKKSKK